MIASMRKDTRAPDRLFDPNYPVDWIDFESSGTSVAIASVSLPIWLVWSSDRTKWWYRHRGKWHGPMSETLAVAEAGKLAWGLFNGADRHELPDDMPEGAE